MVGALHDRVVFVTGSAGGIGAEVARQLVAGGARVLLLDVLEEPLHILADELGESALSVTGDVTDLASLEAAVAAGIDRFGHLDAVLANAGIEALGPVGSMDVSLADRIVEVDLLGVWRTVRAALPALVASQGYALLVSSLSATSAGPYNAPYNAAKAGVVALAKTLRLEVASSGVEVGVAYFSYIATDAARRAVEDPIMMEVMGRMPAAMLRPIPVAKAAAAVVAGIARRSRRVVVPRSGIASVLFPEMAQRLTEFVLRPRPRR